MLRMKSVLNVRLHSKIKQRLGDHGKSVGLLFTVKKKSTRKENCPNPVQEFLSYSKLTMCIFDIIGLN